MPTNTKARIGKKSIAEVSFTSSKAETKNRYVGNCTHCQKEIDHTVKTQDHKPYRWFRCGNCRKVTLIILEDASHE